MKKFTQGKLMKKITSFMLILAFACSLCSTPAYAHGLRSDAEVTEGLELIESFMKIPRSYLTGTTVNQGGMVVFSYDIDGVASAITVTQESDGTTFEVSEGSTVASMKFTNNNELYLNNKNIGTVSPQIQPMAAYEIYWTQTCPYGRASDYSTYYRYDEHSNVLLENALVSIGATILTSILIAEVPALAPCGFSEILSIASVMIDKAPYSTAASYKDTIYVHNVKGYWISGSIDPLGVEKHSTVLYAGAGFNHKSTDSPVITFRCQDF